MGRLCKDYEIRLHKADGQLSLVMVVQATCEGDAKRQAERMLHAGLTNAHIWDDGRLVESLYKLH